MPRIFPFLLAAALATPTVAQAIPDAQVQADVQKSLDN